MKYIILLFAALIYSTIASAKVIIHCPDINFVNSGAASLNTVFYYAEDEFVVYSSRPTLKDQKQNRNWYLSVKFKDNQPYQAWTKLYQQAVKIVLSLDILTGPYIRDEVYICKYQNDKGDVAYLSSYIDNQINIKKLNDRMEQVIF